MVYVCAQIVSYKHMKKLISSFLGQKLPKKLVLDWLLKYLRSLRESTGYNTITLYANDVQTKQCGMTS